MWFMEKKQWDSRELESIEGSARHNIQPLSKKRMPVLPCCCKVAVIYITSSDTSSMEGVMGTLEESFIAGRQYDSHDIMARESRPSVVKRSAWRRWKLTTSRRSFWNKAVWQLGILCPEAIGISGGKVTRISYKDPMTIFTFIESTQRPTALNTFKCKNYKDSLLTATRKKCRDLAREQTRLQNSQRRLVLKNE